MAKSCASADTTRANPALRAGGNVSDVKPVEDIRRDNLLLLIAEAGTAAKLSGLTGVPAPYISQVKRGVQHSTGTKPRIMGNDQARRLETQMGKPRGWMDTDHSALQISSDLNGREGQLVGLFRLLTDAQQVEMVDALTRQLRNPQPPAPQIKPGETVRH